MRYRQLALFVVIPLALALWAGARALGQEKKAADKKPAEEKTADEKAGADKTGAELLASKGLRKIGPFFVLTDEAALKKKLRDLDPVRRKVSDAQKKAADAEKVVEQKKQDILQSLQRRHELEVQLNGVNNVEQHNRIVNWINALGDHIQLQEKWLKDDKGTKLLRASATEVTEHYVEAIMQLRKQCKEVKAKYDALAADEQVKQAMAEVNKGESISGKLGPSADFATVDRNLKKLEGNVVSETIPMRRDEGDLWTVSVTFNGLHSCDLTIDTGSGDVCLPYKLAGEMGLTPSATDPEVTCMLADGHTVKCKMVFAKTVRVGKFTVEHVECGVMPADCPEASAMLGQSFLKHFTFRIDNANGKLIMAQVGPRPRGAGKADAGKTEEPGEDKTGIPATAEGEKGGPEQMVKLLKLDNEKPSDHIDYADPDGQPIQMTRSKWETVDNLRKLGGDPDEIHKIPMKARNPAEKAAPWKMYVWGSLLVIADDTGHTRYFGMTKDKENAATKKPADAEDTKPEPAPPAEETKPKVKKPTEKPAPKKPAAKKPPVKDDDKDVFDK